MRKNLARIRRGEPVNYPLFLRQLPAAVAGRHTQLFRTEKVASNRWRVQCLDDSLLQRLESQAAVPEDRVAAAHQGDSHRAGTDKTYLLVYHGQLVDARPEVVCQSAQQTLQHFTPKPQVLVVENEQNFASPELMMAFTARCTGQPCDFSNTDVVLGAGNRITGTLSVAWLSGYDRVLCAFDYDLGGLRMFASLARRLGDKARFVQPAEWHEWELSFRQSPGSSKRFVSAIEQAEQLGFNELAGTFRRTGHFMEQEMLLDLATSELPDEQ
ncbi:MAG: hypothetical protein EA349_13655 [Halomonadaceae bacterium]|nr:MAG: hypothetical protein EA349_13655 [Halomonadaceae bacterium]